MQSVAANSDSFGDFSRVIDRAVYRPVPDHWWIGATDVVSSTRMIAEGRYKAVNMAGASAISAVMNALGGRDFPFAFGGDGASLAVAPEDEPAVRDALARTVRWAADHLDLSLRAALIPVGDIRRAGHEVLLAYFAPCSAVRYAMFAGGGMEWAEAELKAGNYAVAPAPSGSEPDLTGLSCRWKPISSRAGVMLSVIVRRAPGADEARFVSAVNAALALAGAGEHDGHPVPAEGPDLGGPTLEFELEARAAGPAAPVWGRLKLFAMRLFAWCVMRLGVPIGSFDPAHYRRQTALNSDYRKFLDGLNMTLDCTDEEADRIEALLRTLRDAGTIRFGTFRQREALMTCIVPSPTVDHHFHFIDGAGGGYAEAARALKAATGISPGHT
jgi:hypothetical protein